MRRVAWLVAVITVGGGAGAASVAGSGEDAAPARGACRELAASPAFRREIARVRPLVPKLRRAFGAPGVAVAVGADGRLVWSEACGLADRERGVPVTRRTQFRIGSLSKMLTAVAAARLVEAGRMDADAEVQRYVPSFPRAAAGITIRRLGGHLAGIRHYEGGEAVNTVHYDSVAASVAAFAHDPLVAVPGTRFAYSSYGFDLLGAAIEAAAGTEFGRTVGALVTEPLGMSRTQLDRGGTARGRARFYEVTRARTAVPAPRVDLSDRYPAGGFVSTADDLVRFGLGITSASFFRPATRALLFTSQRTTAGEETGYGFGFEVHASPYGTFAGHTGNVVGGTAFLIVHPPTRVVVALVTNVGYVTAPEPPAVRGAPDPPQLVLPFVRRVLAER